MYLGSDHRGIELKNALLPFLKEEGYEAQDLTPTPDENGRIDFPVIGASVAQAVQKEEEALGILICGSGIGVSIAANRFKGIRAAQVHSTKEITLAKHDDHINVLCLGADNTSIKEAKDFINAWLETKPDHTERRLRRLGQLDQYGT